jgi:hypothetical protein
MAVPLTEKLARSDATQLSVDERQQAVERVSIASAPIVEQRRDVPI